MKLANSPTAINDRRISAKKRLAEQLKSGMKPMKKSATGEEPLTDLDVRRMESEITILTGRIVSPELARATQHKKFRGAK